MSARNAVLALIGEMAVASVNARKARIAARSARNKVAGDWQEEHGDKYRNGDSICDEFIAATAPEQAAYKAAASADRKARAKLVRAVQRFELETREIEAREAGIRG